MAVTATVTATSSKTIFITLTQNFFCTCKLKPPLHLEAMSTLNGQHRHEWTRKSSRGRNIANAITECYIYHLKICNFLCSAIYKFWRLFLFLGTVSTMNQTVCNAFVLYGWSLSMKEQHCTYDNRCKWTIREEKRS